MQSKPLTAGEALYITRCPAPSGFLALENGYERNQISSDGLDPRRRRLLFRSWHRGIREMDLVLGRFADAQIATLSDGRTRRIRAPARSARPADLFDWVNGAQPRAARIRHRVVPPPARLPQRRAASALHDDEVARRCAAAGHGADARASRRRRRRAGAGRSGARDRGARRMRRRSSLAVVCRDGAAHGAARRARWLSSRPDVRDSGIPGLGLPALRPRVAECRRSSRSA